MTYAAPSATMMTTPGQAVYSISPERFQLILQGQPLTNEEIASMTGAGLTGGSVAVPEAVMPTGSSAVAEVAVPTASVVAPPMNTATDITHEPQPELSSKMSSKKSSKKNSKK